MKELGGIVVPLATPFLADGAIDRQAFVEQIAFMEQAGVHAIAVAGSTGEGHTLAGDEIVELTRLAVETVKGRLPVVGSIIVDSTREAIAKAKLLAGLDLAAIQITPVHYLFRPSEDATVEHFRQVCDHVRVPVLIYNVIPWNYPSAELLCRIMREVPGIRGVKQSHADLKLFADLMVSAPKDRWIFTAVDGLLYPSFALGAKGTISALPTAIPHACVALWTAVKAGDHARALGLHEKMIGVWNALLGDNIPACIKYAQSLQGLNAGRPRAPMHEPTEAQRRRIEHALTELGVLARKAA